jgi:acetyl-CoA C-acetyltransferase
MGLVTALSGLVNKPGLAVYAAEPGATPLLLGDLAAEADHATPRVEAVIGYRGPARVAAYTVTYDRSGEPEKCLIVADTSSGARCMASSYDTALARRATSEELIGTIVSVDGGRFDISG